VFPIKARHRKGGARHRKPTQVHYLPKGAMHAVVLVAFIPMLLDGMFRR
jgi:hypothetical protein